MTVRELLDALQGLELDLPVMVYDGDTRGYRSLGVVRVVQDSAGDDFVGLAAYVLER